MTLEQIKQLVDAGQVVNWQSNAYQVIKDSKGQYLISFFSSNYVGLTHLDGTLNGEPFEFYTNNGRTKLVVVEDHTLGYIDPRTPFTVNTFNKSILRGAIFELGYNPINITPPCGLKVTLATRLDFQAMGQEFSPAYWDKSVYEFDPSMRMTVKNLPYHNYISPDLIQQ